MSELTIEPPDDERREGKGLLSPKDYLWLLTFRPLTYTHFVLDVRTNGEEESWRKYARTKLDLEL